MASISAVASTLRPRLQDRRLCSRLACPSRRGALPMAARSQLPRPRPSPPNKALQRVGTAACALAAAAAALLSPEDTALAQTAPSSYSEASARVMTEFPAQRVSPGEAPALRGPAASEAAPRPLPPLDNTEGVSQVWPAAVHLAFLGEERFAEACRDECAGDRCVSRGRISLSCLLPTLTCLLPLPPPPNHHPHQPPLGPDPWRAGQQPARPPGESRRRPAGDGGPRRRRRRRLGRRLPG